MALINSARFISDCGVRLGVEPAASSCSFGVFKAVRCCSCLAGVDEVGVVEVMSIKLGEESEHTEDSTLMTLPGVVFGVVLNVGRNLCGVVRSIKNIDDSRLPASAFFDVDGVPVSSISRLQLSSLSSESTLFGVLLTLLGVAAPSPIVGFTTRVNDFSIRTPVSRGEKEVITTSERAQSSSISLLLCVLVFSLFCVASSRSTLGVVSSRSSAGGVVLSFSSADCVFSALMLELASSSLDSTDVLPSSSELMEYRKLQISQWRIKYI